MKYKVYLLYLIIFVAKTFGQKSSCFQENSRPVELETKNGKVKGNCVSYSTLDDSNLSRKVSVYTWYSIPYAEPPIGSNRFKPPIEVKNWNDVIDGTRVSNSCMQYLNKNISERFEFTNIWSISKSSTSKMSEDCLYLNLFVPADIYVKSNKDLMPIVIFFHGGDSEVGSGLNDIYNPSTFASITNTIVVTVNYRLGIFGFLYLKENNEIFEGNQGLLDQHLAIKWVSENANRFNGDASKITLMGHDFGSKSVGFHLLYEPSWPLFRNAILLSGSPVHLSRSVISSDLALHRSKLFFKEILKCPEGEMIKCALNTDALNLTISSRLFLNRIISNGSQQTAMNIRVPFLPVVDKKVLKESPNRSFRLGKFKKCNLVTSFNGQDGSAQIPFNYGFSDDAKLVAKNNNVKQILNFTLLTDFLKKFYAYYPAWPNHNNEVILNTILSEYTGLTLRTNNNQREMKSNYFFTLSKIITDEGYGCPTFKLIDYMGKSNNKIYLFIYNYRLSSSKWPGWYGAAHGDELATVFGFPLNELDSKSLGVSSSPWKLTSSSRPFTTRDKQVSKELIIRLANFVRDDDPNSKLLKLDKPWPTYKLPTEFSETTDESTNKNEALYLFFRQNSTFVNKVVHDSCHIWNNLIPSHLDFFAEIKAKNHKRVKKSLIQFM